MYKQSKVVIIGLGHVGAHVAYSIAIQGIADEIVMCDVNEAKVKSEQQDLFDSNSLLPHPVKVTVGEYEDLKDCDVVINAAGNIGLLVGMTDRVEELKFTIPQVRKWAPRLKAAGFDGIIINISNPCDVVTREVQKIMQLPKGHVFGTGTGLDTARLIAQIANQVGVAHESIQAFMIGEHGNAQIAAWSCVNFNGMPLDAMKRIDPRYDFDRDDLEDKARMGGWVTLSGKHCTEYAIASVAAIITFNVLHDTKKIMAASAPFEGEYGESGLFAGVPCVIGKGGAERIIELPITEEERKKFHQCAEAIRKNIAIADALA